MPHAGAQAPIYVLPFPYAGGGGPLDNFLADVDHRVAHAQHGYPYSMNGFNQYSMNGFDQFLSNIDALIAQARQPLPLPPEPPVSTFPPGAGDGQLDPEVLQMRQEYAELQFRLQQLQRRMEEYQRGTTSPTRGLRDGAVPLPPGTDLAHGDLALVTLPPSFNDTHGRPIQLTKAAAQDFLKADEAFYKRTGRHIRVTNSHRTRAHHADIQRQYTGTGRLVAKTYEGSDHSWGGAFDTPDFAEAEPELNRFGFYRLAAHLRANDPVHYAHRPSKEARVARRSTSSSHTG